LDLQSSFSHLFSTKCPALQSQKTSRERRMASRGRQGKRCYVKAGTFRLTFSGAKRAIRTVIHPP
jgi:hypothetical protein